MSPSVCSPGTILMMGLPGRVILLRLGRDLREEAMNKPSPSRPFPLPSDLDLRHRSAFDHLVRATAAFLRAHVHKIAPERAFKEMFGDDRDARIGETVLRAATTPATTTNASWAGPMAHATVSQTVVEMASASAAASLIAAGMKLTFDGFAIVHAPGRLVDASDAGNWISEGAPASLRVQRITAGATLTPSKVIVLNAASRETIESSNITEVSRALLLESMAGALDAAVFGTQAAGASPAGILNGVSAQTPTAGGGLNALEGDLRNLTAALVAVGAGRNPALIVNPAQNTSLTLLAGPRFTMPIWPSNAVAAGTVIMVEPTSFASAFAPAPEFEISTQAMLQFQDAPTSDPMAGSPTRSLWQSDLVAWRTKLTAAWGMRAPHLAWCSGVTW